MNILRLKQQARGWHFRCSDAPDMTASNTIAASQAKLSQEQLDWAKSVFAEAAPDRAAATARANTVSDAQLDALNKQTALTDDYANYNKTTFRPLEQGIVADAVGYDTTARRDAAAGQATADVEMNLSAQRGINARNLERQGVNPSSGRTLAMNNQMGIAGAAMKAGAANTARTQVETIGQARKMDAANLGRGLASAQATSAGIALNQGNASVASGMASGAINAGGNAIMNNGYAGVQGGMSSAANTYGNIANASASADAGNMATIGGLASAGATAYASYASRVKAA